MTTIKLPKLILLTLLICVTVVDKATTAEQTAKLAAQPTIAVVDLLDKGPSVELAVLRTAFAEMLSGELSQYQGIGVVERVRVEQFLREDSVRIGRVT